MSAVVFIGALFVGLAATEVGLRLFFPQRMGVWFQDRNGLALHWPGLVTYLPQFGHSVSFNSAGMRDREHAVEKPRGVFRVLVLGDSFMEALQIPFESSFPSLLERGLVERSGKAIEVVNASVSGWGTDDELVYLTTHGLKWKPDLVVIAMTLHNDISDNLRERFHSLQNGKLVDQPVREASFLEYKIIQLRAVMAARLHTYQLLVRAKRTREVQAEATQLRAHVSEQFQEQLDERMARGFQLTGLLFQRMQAVAAAQGTQVVIVLLPLQVQLSAGGPPTRDRPQQMMSEVGTRLDIPVVDLLPEFREWSAQGRPPLFLERDGHWNARGHELASKIVVRSLVDRALIR
jgi:hypothetical protein